MEIRIRIYGDLRKFVRSGRRSVALELPSGATVGDAVKAVGIPPEAPRVTLLGGRRAPDAAALNPDWELVLFSPVAGG
jgi:hypothetical protein